MLLSEPLKEAVGPAFNLYLLLVVVVLVCGVLGSILYKKPVSEDGSSPEVWLPTTRTH